MKKIWRHLEVLEFKQTLDKNYKVKTSLTSGYFNPIVHRGHISLINDAAKHADCLIVVVNGDIATIKKYGFTIPIEDRLANIAQYRCVDFVLEWDKNEMDEIIKHLEPLYFCKGGDVNEKNMKQSEKDQCKAVGCEIIYGCGGNEKITSNTSIINKIVREKHDNGEWEKFRIKLEIEKVV